MQQLNSERFEVIQIDYANKNLPATVQLFKPTVFRDGKAFCCLLGPNPEAGTFGCGFSLESALDDWDEIFNEELARHSDREGIIRFVRQKLAEMKQNR